MLQGCGQAGDCEPPSSPELPTGGPGETEAAPPKTSPGPEGSRRRKARREAKGHRGSDDSLDVNDLCGTGLAPKGRRKEKEGEKAKGKDGKKADKPEKRKEKREARPKKCCDCGCDHIMPYRFWSF